MHELFANVRGPGGFIGIHSGGWTSAGKRLGTPGTDGHIKVRPGEMDDATRFPYGTTMAQDDGLTQSPEWAFTYLSIIIALTDVGPGDGGGCCCYCCCYCSVAILTWPVKQHFVCVG